MPWGLPCREIIKGDTRSLGFDFHGPVTYYLGNWSPSDDYAVLSTLRSGTSRLAVSNVWNLTGIPKCGGHALLLHAR